VLPTDALPHHAARTWRFIDASHIGKLTITLVVEWRRPDSASDKPQHGMHQ
jgi:hypothetical protein